MRIVLRKKRILFIGVFFVILVFSSLFFAQHFSALNMSEKNQAAPILEKQTQVVETKTDNTNNTNNFKYTLLPLSNTEDEKNIPPNAAKRIPVKKEIKKSPPILTVPTSPLSQEQGKEIPLTAPQENEQEIQLPTQTQPGTPKQIEKSPEENLTVIRIVDGDTLVLLNKKTVRLIGINTPEKNQPYYTEAKNTLTELTIGKLVRLEKDISDTDKYGRLLRYVYVNNTFINLEMIRSGYANAYAYPPDTAHKEEFLFTEKTARAEEMGLWKKSTSPQPIILAELHADAEGSDAKNLNGEYVILKNTSNSPISLTHWSIKDAGTHIYTFSDFIFSTNASVTIFSGKGVNTENSLYWNSKDPIWNNDSDTLYLRTATGELAIEYAYSAP